ncbi:hypothetical protein BIW11_02142 [Tropilaelaps mercedesae]|uniref:Uncharacterized protein n=1 Tax=Tropilaelaps mercedesae TaxID=418985 RepID=A0A1V9X2E3_9ACAR|nr:hypothetical protein BIW11_02142 [Tropilaelaps mercedesae]
MEGDHSNGDDASVNSSCEDEYFSSTEFVDEDDDLTIAGLKSAARQQSATRNIPAIDKEFIVGAEQVAEIVCARWSTVENHTVMFLDEHEFKLLYSTWRDARILYIEKEFRCRIVLNDYPTMVPHLVAMPYSTHLVRLAVSKLTSGTANAKSRSKRWSYLPALYRRTARAAISVCVAQRVGVLHMRVRAVPLDVREGNNAPFRGRIPPGSCGCDMDAVCAVTPFGCVLEVEGRAQRQRFRQPGRFHPGEVDVWSHRGDLRRKLMDNRQWHTNGPFGHHFLLRPALVSAISLPCVEKMTSGVPRGLLGQVWMPGHASCGKAARGTAGSFQEFRGYGAVAKEVRATVEAPKAQPSANVVATIVQLGRHTLISQKPEKSVVAGKTHCELPEPLVRVAAAQFPPACTIEEGNALQGITK